MAEHIPKVGDNKPFFTFASSSEMMRPRNRNSTPDSSDEEAPRPQPFRAMGARPVNNGVATGAAGVFSTATISSSELPVAQSTNVQASHAPLSTLQGNFSLVPSTGRTSNPRGLSGSVPPALVPPAPESAAPVPASFSQAPSQGSQLHVSQASAAQIQGAPALSLPAPMTMEQREESRLFAAHMALLETGATSQDHYELSSTPLFTKEVLDHSGSFFSQYGFVAGLSHILNSNAEGNPDPSRLIQPVDPRLFFNISAPSSAFICGSQGSGKSHTLSCLLENCLMKSDVSKLDSPLAGLVFHYDSFTSDVKGTPCEVAHLSSNPSIKVRVFCAPTNLKSIKRTYAGLNVTVEPLRINETDLNTKRMLDLMAVNQDEGRMPLYLHSINRILRDLRLIQQENNSSFNYRQFKREVDFCDMTPAQLLPLNQRLDTLESFMPKSQTSTNPVAQPKKAPGSDFFGNDWSIKPGSLTIVDLSCPCVTSEGACALFNMCLSLFLEQQTSVGRVIGLDEAHKYMNAGAEASTLTNTLLSSIRLQRHLGTRVFISTQEPTISPKLLDLCSITIVHRFTSPDWLRCLRLHLAALSDQNDEDSAQNSKVLMNNLFNKIVKLRVGEALLFAPSAIIGLEEKQHKDGSKETEMKRLGVGYLKIKIRGRVTSDGGKSVFANRTQPTSFGTKTNSSIFGVPPVKPTFGVPNAGSGASGGIKPATSLFSFPSTDNKVFGENNPANPAGVGTTLTKGANTSVFGFSKNSSPFNSGPSAANTDAETSCARSPLSNVTNTPNTTYSMVSPACSATTPGIAFCNPNFDPFKPSQRTEIKGKFKRSIFSIFSSSPAPSTKSAPFQPYVENEPNTTAQYNSFQDLCFQQTYEKFSHEELRLADYAVRLRYLGSEQSLFGGFQ